jgi:hypothetical protein
VGKQWSGGSGMGRQVDEAEGGSGSEAHGGGGRSAGDLRQRRWHH